MNCRTAALVTATSLIAAGLGAQDPFELPAGTPKVSVEAAIVPAEARPGDEVRLELDVSILPGWHIYGGLETTGIPTSITVEEAGGLQVGERKIPDGTKHVAFGFESYWIEKETKLTRALKIPATQAAGEITIRGVMDYMACTEEMCDPPGQVKFEAKLTVVASGGKPPAAGGAKPAAAAPDDAGALPLDLELPAGMSKVSIEPRVVSGDVRAGEMVTVELAVAILPGWHIYGALEGTGTPTSVSFDETGGLQMHGDAVVPGGDPHVAFGMESFWIVGSAEITQQLVVPVGTPPGKIHLKGALDYMACTEEMCDPAGQESFELDVVVVAGAARPDRLPPANAPSTVEPASGGSGGTRKEAVQEPVEPALDRDDEDLAAMPLSLFLLIAVGWGLFTLAMPCTYPMIPITISFFTKQADARGGSVLSLALVYGLGIIAIFVLIGVVIGNAIVPFATHPVTNLVIAVLFLVFALVLFGLINLQPPQSMMNLATKASSQGGYVGVFLMGATLVVTSFTCTAPFVGNLLALGAEGGYGRVALGMATFGATMAIPFVFLSLVPGKLRSIPRSGEWMNTLKVTLGFVEVAAALKFLSNVDLAWGWGFLSRELFLFLWAGIFVITGLFLLGMIRLKGESGEIGAGRLVGALSFLVLAIYCGYCGSGNKLDPVMAAIAPNYHNRESDTEAIVVIDDFEKARKLALEKKKKVMLNFTGVT